MSLTRRSPGKYALVLMTQLFGRFSAADSRVHLPGAAFVAAATLALTSLVIYWVTTREKVATTHARINPASPILETETS